MKTIWKYSLDRDRDITEILVPQGAEFITAQVQMDWVCVWALVDPDAPKVTRQILLVGTGSPVRCGPVKYIATVQRGEYVFHAFEVLPDTEKE